MIFLIRPYLLRKSVSTAAARYGVSLSVALRRATIPKALRSAATRLAPARHYTESAALRRDPLAPARSHTKSAALRRDPPRSSAPHCCAPKACRIRAVAPGYDTSDTAALFAQVSLYGSSSRGGVSGIERATVNHSRFSGAPERRASRSGLPEAPHCCARTPCIYVIVSPGASISDTAAAFAQIIFHGSSSRDGVSLRRRVSVGHVGAARSAALLRVHATYLCNCFTQNWYF
jgi:hypothetical protein